jgi:hypothetical protein
VAVLFVIAGVVLVGIGYALLTNRAAQDWWMAFDKRQRDTYGWLIGWPFPYTRRRTRSSGIWTMLLGVVFLVAGFSELT